MIFFCVWFSYCLPSKLLVSVFIEIVLVFPCSDFPDISYSDSFDTHPHTHKSLSAFIFTKKKKKVKNCTSHFEALKRVLLGYTHDSWNQPSIMPIDARIGFSNERSAIVNYCQKCHIHKIPKLWLCATFILGRVFEWPLEITVWFHFDSLFSGLKWITL